MVDGYALAVVTSLRVSTTLRPESYVDIPLEDVDRYTKALELRTNSQGETWLLTFTDSAFELEDLRTRTKVTMLC